MSLIHLQRAGVGVVADLTGSGLPRILYWGAHLGVLDASASICTVLKPAVSHSPYDQPWDVRILHRSRRPGLGRRRRGLMGREGLVTVRPDVGLPRCGAGVRPVPECGMWWEGRECTAGSCPVRNQCEDLPLCEDLTPVFAG